VSDALRVTSATSGVGGCASASATSIVGAERADEVQAGDGVRCETVSTSIFREIREKYMDIM
jgi:hypothetical protein